MEKYIASSDGYEVECCCNCGREIEIRWDINRDGFHAVCPVCGSRLMLCDACQHRRGDYSNDCDYNQATDKCRFQRESGWWKEKHDEDIG